jgi:hypothetical protein
VFNQPVELAYRLSQNQVPGTPLELGLYDSVSGKINLLSQSAAVSGNGRNVSFSLNHFSTYAVLKPFVSNGAPIGPGVKIPLPDMLTGAYSFKFPLTISPGRRGAQPALSLNYSSSNSNSWLGQGFNLNPGHIVRSTRLGPPKYNDQQDTFYLITDAGTTELVYLTENIYQAKVESGFSKFYKESDDSWRVVAKDGSIMRFGQTADSREVAAKGTYSWYLTKSVDTNGNYVEYQYSKDQGKTYLYRINYTGNENGVSPTNSVEFSLEDRPDVPSSYISGSAIVTAKRLKEIISKVNDDLVWRWVLEYVVSLDTGRSLLKSITQSGADGKTLPKQIFEYQGS